VIRVSVWCGDLSDAYLRLVTQLGVDCLDFGAGDGLPGVKEQGYPDLDALLALKKRLRSWGLEINRVTLPDLTEEYMLGRAGAERELENSCQAMRVFGAAGVPMARQRLAGDVFPWMTRASTAAHRGGYRYRAESVALAADPAGPPAAAALDAWWTRFCAAYTRLVPLAEDGGVRLLVHPSDTPHPDTPLGSLGFHRVTDAFPNRCVGYLYCCGTRAQAGGSPLVLDEIHHYGRKGRIATVHLRNVRGSLATAGAFEEVLLDDGDLNPFKILLALRQAGFDGCINPDHIPALEGDGAAVHHGLSYSVGYLKALLAALATV
jgi:mannonate dehydratase